MARNKYHNIKCEFNGIPFDSQAERDYYIYLYSLEQSGEIENLQCQVTFGLLESFKDNQGNHERAIHYIADFTYMIGDVCHVVDVKSEATRTATYQIKKKLFKHKYPEFIFEEIVT
jgi:hypothetical protein